MADEYSANPYLAFQQAATREFADIKESLKEIQGELHGAGREEGGIAGRLYLIEWQMREFRKDFDRLHEKDAERRADEDKEAKEERLEVMRGRTRLRVAMIMAGASLLGFVAELLFKLK